MNYFKYTLFAFVASVVFSACTAFSQTEIERQTNTNRPLTEESFEVTEESPIVIEEKEKKDNTESKAKIERKRFVNAVLERAKSLEGVPYVYGGKSPKGFDCSGFLYYVYGQEGVKLPASSRYFDAVGEEVALEDALPGDIVLFTGTNPSIDRTGHVGIVVENEEDKPLKFIHATSGKKYSVAYSNIIPNRHYDKRFRGIRRVATPQTK